MPSDYSDSPYWLHWKSTLSTNVSQTEASLGRFDFLSFLATAQALEIGFLAMAWDASGSFAAGGTSTIHQTLVNLDTNFAFKTYSEGTVAEEQMFRMLITEITILRQPSVREHANLIQLQGICFDVSFKDNKPWPVLVFEKSPLGDLYRFTANEGWNMTLEDRLSFCADIGKAMADMHSNSMFIPTVEVYVTLKQYEDIMHGDLKPENVLIFKDSSGRYIARVIDFGFSARYADKDQLLSLPRSRPWNAPENEGQVLWTPKQAVKADLFCFGMLCINKSIADFYQCDYRLRSHIAQCLLSKTPRSAASDLQIALCYYLGFGVTRDVAKAQEFMLRSNHGLQTIQDIIAHPQLLNPSLQSSLMFSLAAKNQMPQFDFNYVYLEQGRLAEAKVQLTQDMEMLASIYTFNHPLTVQSQRRLADLYVLQARWKEAEKLFMDIIYTLGMNIGEEHPFTLTTMHELASIFTAQGQWKKAERLEVLVMETYKKAQGEDHPHMQACMGSLALIYSYQGQWKEAERLLAQVIEVREKTYGEDHPDTLSSIAGLAEIYCKQGRLEEAGRLGAQVMESYKKTQGRDHPKTLSSMAHLAAVYRKQGRLEEAERLGVRVMETRKARLREDHPDTLSSMVELASTYGNQGRLEEAERLEVRVMETCKMTLTPGHPYIRTSMSQLATTYRRQGRWEEAENLAVQALNICETELGQDNLDTLSSKANLAFTLSEQGRWEEAERLQVQTTEAFRTTLGEAHPTTLTSIAHLTSTYRNQGRWEELATLWESVLEARGRTLGEDFYPSTLHAMHNLAWTYRELARLEDAKTLMKQYAQLLRVKLGAAHADYLAAAETLAEWES
ncbi:hypothetical protein NLG97_g6579 [Lecanicillium saksenae]|uniref:Uncharacterized protein n=1 Tax=Lecanicillium saksenae TaxID=468837 RepID=A0ACC1QT15_9HYPO|nr:hypothetical protein NLG97_g6579 [Lecanicillium saksenae]